MAATLRELRGRIRSAGSIKKITKAQELIATSRISKAQARVENARPYAEEMTNYANWYAYYRTRMQAMKTAASRSFEPISNKYRIGYYSINNNTNNSTTNYNLIGGKH